MAEPQKKPDLSAEFKAYTGSKIHNFLGRNFDPELDADAIGQSTTLLIYNPEKSVEQRIGSAPPKPTTDIPIYDATDETHRLIKKGDLPEPKSREEFFNQVYSVMSDYLDNAPDEMKAEKNFGDLKAKFGLQKSYLEQYTNSFEFRVGNLHEALNATTVDDEMRKSLLKVIPADKSGMDLPNNLLTDKEVLQDFIIQRHSNDANPVQAFLDKFQTQLPDNHPLKTYKSPTDSTDYTKGEEEVASAVTKITARMNRIYDESLGEFPPIVRPVPEPPDYPAANVPPPPPEAVRINDGGDAPLYVPDGEAVSPLKTPMKNPPVPKVLPPGSAAQDTPRGI